MKIYTTYGIRLNLYIYLFLFLSLSLNQSLFSQTYGLKFNSQNVTLDKRTELNLSPDDFMKFKDEFEIAFDYKTTRISPNSGLGFFGYVFRIIDKEDNNIDLLSTPTPRIGLNLVIGESNSIIPVRYPLDWINKWVRLRIKFVLSEDRIIFYTPDSSYVQENIGFKRQEQIKIIFGANDYKQFKNSDVPSMAIRDIKITEKGKLKYFWPLDEKKGPRAIDKIDGVKAKVINPSWLAYNHQHWQENFTYDFQGAVNVAADVEDGKIFMVGKDELIVFSSQENTFHKIEFKKELPIVIQGSRAIFNSTNKKIYCYIVDEGPCYSINPETGEWKEIISSGAVGPPFYRHHNSIFYTPGNNIYIFGGYGLHKYSNSIIEIDLTQKKWFDLPTNDSIFQPRYLAGLGMLNDTIYILGGYGSESGNQLINPQSYFDLFGYSIKDSSLFEKFEIPHLMDDMIVGNSIYIDGKTRNYFTLVFSKIKFNGYLQLIKGNLDSPEVELVGDKIPFKFLDIRSFTDLYYFPNKNKLYAYESYTTDSTTQVAIYSIDYPPNNALNDTLVAKSNHSIIKYIIAVVILILLSGIFIWKLQNKRKKSKTDGKLINVNDLSPENINTTIENIDYQIIFFGGFQVFNKDFEDVTYKFSPLLKELFLLIMLYTLKNDKGISADKITEVLWYDKSEKSARNNRAVNIAKLRSILEEIGKCELTKKTGYWKIIFLDSNIKSDYIDFINITSSKSNLNKQKVMRLIDITQKGAFLSNLHYDWLDDFKASVSDRIIDTLVKFGQSIDVKTEADFVIHLADSIFNFDTVNEEAMILKCQAEYCMGKHGLARATYERFFKEYLANYGQEYDRAFLDILEIKE